MSKRIGYAKTMNGKLVMDLGQPFPVYQTKKEAENAIKESEAALFGIKCLYSDFRSPFKVREVRFLIVKQKLLTKLISKSQTK